MEAKEFNELMSSQKNDKNAANKLHLYCLSIIKKRLIFRNGFNDLESLSHSVLEKFIKNLPDYYITAPVSYLNKCTDNFLSNLKHKQRRNVPLISDISYEQNFEELEALDTFSRLEELLGKEDAFLIYGHYVEKVDERQLAKEINITYTAARQRISRAKKKLKEKLR